jgi:urea transport system substrate-binding protein
MSMEEPFGWGLDGLLSRRTLVRRGLAAAAAAGPAGALLSGCGAAGEKKEAGAAKGAAGAITVGVISPLSGAWTVYGKAHRAGFDFGVSELNAAGGDREYKVVVADSKTEPRIVTEQANRLIRQEQVDFLAGTFSSAERNAAGPVVTSGKKLLLYPTFYEGQQEKYYPGVCNKNIFMFGPEPTQQVWPHLDYMMDKFGKNFYMIGSDYVWPRVTNEVTKEGLEERGGKVVGETYIPFNTPQYASVLREIRRSGADIIFHTLTGTDTVNFRRQFHAAGMKEDFVLWTVDDEEAATTGVGPEASAGDYVSFDYFWTIDTPNNNAFKERFRQKYPDVLMDTVGVAMYNAAHMLGMAVEKAGSAETDAVRKALEGMTFDKAPQGAVEMRADDHQLVVPSYLMRVREGWTGPDDMFEEIRSVKRAEPQPARCSLK